MKIHFNYIIKLKVSNIIFNSQVDIFIERTREKLRKFFISNNINFNEEELNSLLRYYLYWIGDKRRKPEGFNFRFENYRGTIRDENKKEIINPFQHIEREIKNYILSTNEEQSKKLINLDKIIDSISIVVKEFQDSLQPIIDNSFIGIKDICKIENDLSWFKKIKCIFD